MTTSIPNISIVYESEDLLIVDKPPGLSVHKEPHLDATNTQQSLPPIIDCIKLQHTHLNNIELRLAHRLDKVTSGLLILAKHQQAARILGNLFQQRQIGKYYLALSDKKPKKKQGSVIGDMEKSRNSQWKLTQTKLNPAITRFHSKAVNGNRLFILKLESGKTHQIRVALKSVGSPILGDKLYSGSTSDRTYLHAYSLNFNYLDQVIHICQPPSFGEHFSCSTLHTALAEYQTPSQLHWPTRK